jgi:hypothetical protein
VANVSFLGSKDLSPEEVIRVREFVTEFMNTNCSGADAKYDNVYVSNGSGVPAIATDIAHNLRVNYETIPTKVYKWDAVGGFRDTNAEIIDKSDYVVILCTEDTNSGGVGWCERYVRRVGKPCKVVWVSNPTTEATSGDTEPVAAEEE